MRGKARAPVPAAISARASDRHRRGGTLLAPEDLAGLRVPCIESGLLAATARPRTAAPFKWPELVGGSAGTAEAGLGPRSLHGWSGQRACQGPDRWRSRSGRRAASDEFSWSYEPSHRRVRRRIRRPRPRRETGKKHGARSNCPARSGDLCYRSDAAGWNRTTAARRPAGPTEWSRRPGP